MASDPSTERFDGYEAEIKLVQAELSQKLDQIAELSGDERRSAVKQAEGSLEEAKELVRYVITPC
jgi:vesicle transport through interaction with t-SNAREs 1